MKTRSSLREQLYRLLLVAKDNIKNYPVAYIYNAKILINLANEEMSEILGVEKSQILDEILRIGDDKNLNNAVYKCKKFLEILNSLDRDLNSYDNPKMLNFKIDEIPDMVDNYMNVFSYLDNLQNF